MRERKGRSRMTEDDMALALYPATEKQVDYIKFLLTSRVADAARAASIGQRIADGTMDRQFASEAITYLKAQPKAAAAPKAYDKKPEAVLTEGMYRMDGDIYRVQRSRESGNLYAKVMILPDFPGDKPGFEYAPGAIRRLTEADRMTLSEAKAWGVETGICCVCGAFLTDPESVEAGIGPVCAKRF